MANEGFHAKFLALAILMIVSFNLLFSLFTPQSSFFAKAESLAMKSGQCDIFFGEWVPDPSGPAYANSSCNFIPCEQDCMTNGRPDIGYLYWRWKPFGCDSPRVDVAKFLNFMRHKSMVFIGESVVHNQILSLLCILSQVEEAILVYHDKTWQTKTWYLPGHNVTLGLIWSPFLVASTEAQSHTDIQIWLDTLDKAWTEQYPKYDYVFFSGGQWFLKQTVFLENNTVIGCHYCPGKNLKELGMDYSYRKALQLTYQYFMSIPDHKPLVIFRTWVPDHKTGGGCIDRTQPFKEGEYDIKEVDQTMREVELEEFERGSKIGDLRLKLFDIYYLSLLRPDGHPGPYREFHPDMSRNPEIDCLHWCLPGLPDTWNELLMEMILLSEEKLMRSVS